MFSSSIKLHPQIGRLDVPLYAVRFSVEHLSSLLLMLSLVVPIQIIQYFAGLVQLYSLPFSCVHKNAIVCRETNNAPPSLGKLVGANLKFCRLQPLSNYE